MGVDLKTALAYARERHEGVLATIGADGRPQLSNVVYQIAVDGTIVITSFASRRKIRNLGLEVFQRGGHLVEADRVCSGHRYALCTNCYLRRNVKKVAEHEVKKRCYIEQNKILDGADAPVPPVDRRRRFD